MCNHFYSGKASECAFVALGIQHAMRMRRTISSVVCPAVPYFSTLSHNDTTFKRKVTEYKQFFLFSLQLLSETFLIIRRTERDINVRKSACTVPLFLSHFDESLVFSKYFRKNPQMQNFTKILPLAAELFNAARRTDGHDEANSRFSQFCESA